MQHTLASPLHLAAGNGSTALLNLLLDNGADISLGKVRMPPVCPCSGIQSVVLALWGGFQRRGLTYIQNDETPLTYAVTKGHVAASILLISRGDDPFLKNTVSAVLLSLQVAVSDHASQSGRTPLAVMLNHASRKEFLLGCTQISSVKLASAWLEHRTEDGSDIPLDEWNACDQEGNTPILNYVRHANNAFANQGMSNWHGIVRKLLLKGVKLKAVNFVRPRRAGTACAC